MYDLADLNQVSKTLGLGEHWIDVSDLPSGIISRITDVLIVHAKKLGESTHRPRSSYCHQCEAPWPIMFGIHDNIWLSVADRKEFICAACFSARLGRKLTLADFKKCNSTEAMVSLFSVVEL